MTLKYCESEEWLYSKFVISRADAPGRPLRHWTMKNMTVYQMAWFTTLLWRVLGDFNGENSLHGIVRENVEPRNAANAREAHCHQTDIISRMRTILTDSSVLSCARVQRRKRRKSVLIFFIECFGTDRTAWHRQRFIQMMLKLTELPSLSASLPSTDALPHSRHDERPRTTINYRKYPVHGYSAKTMSYSFSVENRQPTEIGICSSATTVNYSTLHSTVQLWPLNFIRMRCVEPNCSAVKRWVKHISTQQVHRETPLHRKALSTTNALKIVEHYFWAVQGGESLIVKYNHVL